MANIPKNIGTEQGFGKRLRLLRKKRGFSQDAFAKKIGYKAGASISNIESETSPPDFTKLPQIAEILKVDLHWLITGQLSHSTKEILLALKPHAVEYLSNLHEEIDREKADVFRLSLDQAIGGAASEEEVKKATEIVNQKQDAYDRFKAILVEQFGILNSENQ